MISKKNIYLVTEENIENSFLISNCGKYNICGIVSDTYNKQSIYPVYSFEWISENFYRDDLLVVADEKNMVSLVKKLNMYKLELIKDWVPFWLAGTSLIDWERLYYFVGQDIERFNRALFELKMYGKIVYLHGNCQTHAIYYYIRHNEELNKNYNFLKMPQLWNAAHTNKYRLLHSTRVLQYVDILVTQIVADDNKFGQEVATSSFISEISEGCIVKYITKCFCDLYFKQYSRPKNIDDKALWDIIDENGLKLYKGRIDYVIAKMVLLGKSINEIIDYVFECDIFTKEYVCVNCEQFIKDTRRRENDVDVSMWDYYWENINKDVMYVTTQHPTEKVMVEFSKRVLACMGIKDNTVNYDGSYLAKGISNDEKLFIYPCIYKNLGLNEHNKYIIYELPNGEKVSGREYIRNYIKTVFPSVRVN